MLQKTQPTLKEVQQQFENWRRRHKNHRALIPAALWETAASLSGQYSIHEISKRLRLNHTALRDRVAAYRQGEGIKPKEPAFIELDMISSRAAAGEYIIEIEKADARMKIILKGNYPDIAGISKAFLG
jgi:hypothetical protein